MTWMFPARRGRGTADRDHADPCVVPCRPEGHDTLPDEFELDGRWQAVEPLAAELDFWRDPR